ncbi:hypothetical protein [Streptomyces sp. NPDC101455]|uniref:hypothetical protein n=1 Tax=Streptomyces sp. NPDC101455 TaxID=3366142 RepID=UPI00382AE046
MDTTRAYHLTQECLAATQSEDKGRRGLALRALGERLEEAGPGLYGERLQQAVEHSTMAATAHIAMLTGLDTEEAAIVTQALMRRLL